MSENDLEATLASSQREKKTYEKGSISNYHLFSNRSRCCLIVETNLPLWHKSAAAAFKKRYWLLVIDHEEIVRCLHNKSARFDDWKLSFLIVCEKA